ncbi:c-type cytochrome [Sporichthya polymorpha]|uniref:cytochrome bc1 complex diheme cytochrome c subunit n=1 Tax=Sporichthya polymorpha TaxID=35751 RepID=UPI00039A14DA|nr:c-type cytochrome [Sporichthya polymorpha]
MKRLSARRRHPLAAVVVLLLALGVVGGLYATFSPSGTAEAADDASSLQIQEGKGLYITSCSSCHGLNAEGTSDGPGIAGVGAASVDFQVGTGRMPLQSRENQGPAKKQFFTEKETAAIVAYVASIAPGGAPVPAPEQYATDGDLQEGGEIFRTNCASCHNFIGKGGALTQGKYAPNLTEVDPKHIYEAMVTGAGKGAMPTFSDGILTPDQKKDVITYIKSIHEQPDPGGFAAGRIGPVAEGLLVWTAVIGALIGAAVWLGARPS